MNTAGPKPTQSHCIIQSASNNGITITFEQSEDFVNLIEEQAGTITSLLGSELTDEDREAYEMEAAGGSGDVPPFSLVLCKKGGAARQGCAASMALIEVFRCLLSGTTAN